MSANVSSNFSSPLADDCFNLSIALNVIRLIPLLPFSIILLYLGVQKWRQQHSLQTASHSDVFAYHMAAMELVWILGWFMFLGSYYVSVAALGLLGQCLRVLVFYGEIIFHVLTCAERYLAVVHPVIYVGLKNSRGVRIRNISIGCVWVLSFVLMSIHSVMVDCKSVGLFCLLAVSLLVTFYCSVSVLCVLIRPGPGDAAKEKERVDQSKQRAFYTIVAISATLWLWFAGILVAFALAVKNYNSQNYVVSCIFVSIASFLNLPSCLVSPLLYLHRAGKLTFSCCTRE